MARTSLPPGFRFHPTDVELVMYYLKRMVMGKKFRFEAIAEVNINNFSPWDLPDKSCVRSKDLEWFFFCPREKKYSSGTRVKRATENGYWKTTGKDRPIHHNGKLVGTVKTLIFHLGHAPRGERTDWVLHEYRILDDKLAAAGVQDTYVLCKVFKKNGPGPKNGAQYGAPFNEADWTDDEDGAPNHAISVASGGSSPTTQLQAEEQTCPITNLSGPGNKSGVSVINDQSTSSAHPTSDVFLDKTEDEMNRLLAQFTDDDMMLFHGSGVNQGDLSGKGKSILPCSDGYDIFNGLSDLDAWPRVNEDRLDSLRVHNDNYFLENNLFLDNSGYIELNDLLPSLDSQIGFTENAQSSTGDPFRPLHEIIQQPNSGAYSAGIDEYAAYSNQLPMLPQTVNNSLYQGGSNAAYDLDFVLGPLVTDMDFAQCIERGSSAD